eukprot:TRINITY_DN9300_c0_g1_i1.p2 TRINITY_DN9300_c0_g1~~TRINITY_DN9300_c0_g1_i1.p2  ORF type:complete len:140 (+),score=28.72 TRINITY_DN9300_c0_g1_i1:200-619(+)
MPAGTKRKTDHDSEHPMEQGGRTPTEPARRRRGPAPFSTLREHDDGGHLLQHTLKHCAPPFMANPALMWRCAASARFLREAVYEMESPDGKDPDLEQVRGWKAMLALWNAGKHRQGWQTLELLIPIMLRCRTRGCSDDR